MNRRTSGSWKAGVYFSATIGAAAIVLGILFLVIRQVHPEFSLVGLDKIDLFIAGFVAYGTVVAVTFLLKRWCGQKFGSYLDDPDVIESTPRPPLEKLCSRCHLRFAVHHNEFHAAGFCSRGCRDAFTRGAAVR